MRLVCVKIKRLLREEQHRNVFCDFLIKLVLEELLCDIIFYGCLFEENDKEFVPVFQIIIKQLFIERAAYS